MQIDSANDHTVLLHKSAAKEKSWHYEVTPGLQCEIPGIVLRVPAMIDDPTEVVIVTLCQVLRALKLETRPVDSRLTKLGG